MDLHHKNFSTSIEPKSFTYSDNYFKLKGNYISTSNNINFIVYDAFKDVNDVKTNNFSNLILTKKQLNSEIIEPTKILSSKFPDIVTTLSFFSNNPNDELNPGVWLAIDKTFDTYDIDTTTSSFKLIKGLPENYSNCLFHLKCIDEQICTISHTFGDSTYYLTYDKGFKMSLSPVNGKFTYHIDNGMLRLYCIKDNFLSQIVCDELNGQWGLTLATEEVPAERAIIYINNEEESLNQFINASWVVYNRENVINRINPEKSILNLESQFLIHNEYADENDKINLIPLKNNLTYQGTVTNGNNLVLSNNGKFISTPLVDYRNYISINSGLNQEHGSENITLTFNFTDQLYHLNEGDECIFSLPLAGEETIFGPLYPYDSININDTSFVRNGAFGSNVPYFADKFKKFQNHNNKTNNYTYLCTWLYQPEDGSTPIWLDRYYYPDLVSRKKLYNEECFSLSFENNLDLFYFNETLNNISGYEKELMTSFEKAIEERGYADKKSDITIEEGTTYKYSRISKETVNNVFNNLNENRINDIKDEHLNTVNLESPFSLNGKQWRKIPGEKFNNSHSINFNTDIYINPRKKIGIQLFGCDYKYGFNIQNRKDLSPFSYFATKESVYMFNNKFAICNQFDVKEKYNTEIKYLVISAPFDDLYLFTESSIFILDYDLRIKNEILLKTILDNGNINLKYAELLYNTHIIVHNKNLYAVVNEGDINDINFKTNILKIIVNPESDLEKELIKDNFITARFLNLDEYYTNFNMEYSSSLSQSMPIIKSIYMANDTLYAFNYDILKMSHDGDTIYGIIKEKNEYFNNWYYIFNQSLGKLYTDVAASKYAEFTSDIAIDTIAYGSDGFFGIVRGFDNKNNDNKNKALEIYDKSKTKIYNYPLTDYDKIISLDYYRYIDDNNEEHDAFIAFLRKGGFLNIVEYQIDKESVKTYVTSINKEQIPTFRNIIDSNTFINKLDENKIYFNLYISDTSNPLTYEWDLFDAQEGWYNINVELDYSEAIFNIKINDIVVAKINSETNSNFIKHAHLNTSIFDSTYYFGSIGKKYGTTLNEILNGNQVTDPYAIKNTKVENMTLYNRLLSYYEYQANRLYFSKINPLVLTLPCGIRNGIEEIIRYFKFAKPGSTTNKVKINISGLNDIKLENETEILKELIIDSLNNSDYLNNIKEIEFI